MSSINSVSAVPPQVQASATGKAYDAQKQEGQAAIKLIESASQTTKTAQPSGPQATGNNVDVIV